MASYNYNISDLKNGYDPVQLCKDINYSDNISQNVIYINGDYESDQMIISFDNSLTDEEKVVLDEIVNNSVLLENVSQMTNVDIDMMGNLIRNIGSAVLGTDVVNKTYVDDAISNIDINGINLNKIQNQIASNKSNVDLHIANNSNPHNITKQQIGLGNVNNVKHNLDATTRPGNLDDSVSGYSKGSLWLNKPTGKVYICINNTELNAVWTEITNQGEKIVINKLGNGTELFSHKVDANVYLKSIIGSNNVSIESDNSTIILKSKNSHSFILSSTTIEVVNENYNCDLLFFPWMQSEFQNYRNGKIIFEATIPATNPMSIRALNRTNDSVLGELVDLSNSGIYQMNIANPSANSRIVIQVKKYDSNEPNSIIHGIILSYDS